MNQQVQDFFSQFDHATQSSNWPAFQHLYADQFMFGGPNGVQIVEREGFIKVLPRMKAHLASMGLLQSQVQSIEAHELDTRYLPAKVGWRTGIQSPAGNTHVDISATFVLARGSEDTLSIVFQIDHQDLTAIIRNLHQVQ